MSNLSIFDFDGQSVRVGGTPDEPWFIASDVCRVLDLENVSKAVDRLDEDEKRDDLTTSDSIGRTQLVLAVNESGLYSLIFTSRKQESKRFKKWVTSEVLPSIRKSGSYSALKITPDHIAAHGFQQFEFLPFQEKSPIAASIFLDWQGIQQRAINGAREVQVIAPQPVEFALPSEAMQEALNGAFLNLNRSGLAMNKLFHFLDRIPTMKSMGSEAIDELAEALTEAGRTIEDLQEERNTWKTAALSGASKLAELQKEIGTWKKQCKESQGQADSVRRAADNFSNEVKDLKQQIKNLKTRTTSPTANAIVVSEGRKRKALPPMRSADPT